MTEPDTTQKVSQPKASSDLVSTQADQGSEVTLTHVEAESGSFHASSAVPTHIAVGTCLDAYEMVEKLGEGGMGAVWKARHVKLDKFVALKILPQNLTSDPEIVRRFEREMRAVGKIEHPHVVRAMDAREVGGVHFLVMEYVDGIDLSKHVKLRGPRSVSDACVMVRHAALGLAAAHAQGLIHRDVKPSNLLLSKEGQVKVLDLGLARLMTEEPELRQLTQSGQLLGTPDYMAPEQWDDTHAVDHRVDLYALGCTFYFLLAGRAPFGDDRHTTLKQKLKAHVLEAPPRLRDVRPEVPEDLDQLYGRLMAKEPSQRLSSAAEVASRLKEIVVRLNTKSAPARGVESVTPTRDGVFEDAPHRFGYSCSVCGTRMDFASTQIGEQGTCPDCFTVFEIPAPGPRSARTSSTGGELRPPDRLDLEAPRDDSGRPNSSDSLKQQAELLLKKAALELESLEREKELDGTFSETAVRSFFQFLAAPSTISRIVLLSMMGSVALAFAALATRIEGGGAYGLRDAMIFVGTAVTLGLWFTVLSAHALALLQNPAERVGEVENWPGVNFWKWRGAPFQLGLAIGLAVFPGLLLSAPLTFLGVSAWLVGILIPMSLIAFLPIILLSMLHQQSWFAAYSNEVWCKMRRASSATITFYQGATLMGIIAWMTLMVTWFGQPLLAVPQAAILVMLAFLYFRLLAWLTQAMENVREEP